MLTNQLFLDRILNSFNSFIRIGTSRSTAKLKPLHGAIAMDIAQRLGCHYVIKSQGYDDDREASIQGRYMEKKVDITVIRKTDQRPVAGIAIKFVMQNYSQNSNNYFENMLGETANIRTSSCPYFQVFIILDKLPYYKNTGVLTKWEEFTEHNVNKYYKLSKDSVDSFFHTPNKTLIYVVHLMPEPTDDITNKNKYLDYYKHTTPTIQLSSHHYDGIQTDGTVIINDYEKFIDRVYHTVMSL